MLALTVDDNLYVLSVIYLQVALTSWRFWLSRVTFGEAFKRAVSQCNVIATWFRSRRTLPQGTEAEEDEIAWLAEKEMEKLRKTNVHFLSNVMSWLLISYGGVIATSASLFGPMVPIPAVAGLYAFFAASTLISINQITITPRRMFWIHILMFLYTGSVGFQQPTLHRFLMGNVIVWIFCVPVSLAMMMYKVSLFGLVWVMAGRLYSLPHHLGRGEGLREDEILDAYRFAAWVEVASTFAAVVVVYCFEDVQRRRVTQSITRQVAQVELTSVQKLLTSLVDSVIYLNQDLKIVGPAGKFVNLFRNGADGASAAPINSQKFTTYMNSVDQKRFEAFVSSTDQECSEEGVGTAYFAPALHVSLRNPMSKWLSVEVFHVPIQNRKPGHAQHLLGIREVVEEPSWRRGDEQQDPGARLTCARNFVPNGVPNNVPNNVPANVPNGGHAAVTNGWRPQVGGSGDIRDLRPSPEKQLIQPYGRQLETGPGSFAEIPWRPAPSLEQGSVDEEAARVSSPGEAACPISHAQDCTGKSRL